MRHYKLIFRTLQLLKFILWAFLSLLISPNTLASEAGFPSLEIPQGFGVNIHFTHPKPGEMEMIAASGVQWVRMDFTWEAIEQEKAVYDFSAYDHLLTQLDRHGLRALFILDYGNPLYDQGLAPHTEEARKAFARWAVASVKHFKDRGILWEIWNEPNHDPFWKPKPNVDNYTLLALATGRAILEEVPNAAIIGPASSRFPFAFLKKCFEAGLLDFWAGVSVHPYRYELPPETVIRDYQELAQLIKKYNSGQTPVPILAAEWGYPDIHFGLNEIIQAKYLARMWLTNLSNEIPLSIWYDWQDDGPDPHDHQHHFGLVRFQPELNQKGIYEKKPSFEAVATLIHSLSGFQFEKRIKKGNQQDFILEFSRNGERRWVAWTLRRWTKPLELAVPPGTYQLTGYRGRYRIHQSTKNGRLEVNMRDAPVYILPAKEASRL